MIILSSTQWKLKLVFIYLIAALAVSVCVSVCVIYSILQQLVMLGLVRRKMSNVPMALRCLSDAKQVSVADASRFAQYIARVVHGDQPAITPRIIAARPSPHHGNGIFARVNIPKGTVLCDATPVKQEDKEGTDPVESGAHEFINDLNYSHARRLANCAETNVQDMTYEDYQRFVKEYCNLEAVAQTTNVVVTKVGDKFYLESHRDVAEGEELSRLYTVQFWLNHHMSALMAAQEEGIYEATHPLTRTMLELTDPYSLRLFAAVHRYHNEPQEEEGAEGQGGHSDSDSVQAK